MSNEPEWKDANPSTENLPGKGKIIIQLVIGGIALGILTIVGMRIRPIGLAVGSFTFFSGLMMLMRRRTYKYKPGLIVTACGFLLLLANPRFGVIAGFAGYFAIVVALGLMVFGLFKAIKLAWDVQR